LVQNEEEQGDDSNAGMMAPHLIQPSAAPAAELGEYQVDVPIREEEEAHDEEDHQFPSCDDLLTDDEADNEACNLGDEPHLQGPMTIGQILQHITCTRDIDSISLFSPSLPALLNSLEKTSIIKLSRSIGDTPTSSSRHSVKQKLWKTNGRSVTKYTPLHDFQNITLGIVIANNIRFHLNIFSLKNEGISKTSGYRPMSLVKRLVIVAAMNLARMLQCHRARRIKKAWISHCQEGGSDTVISTRNEINSLLQERIDADVCTPIIVQNWVSGGELFYLKHDSTKVSEVSSAKTDALSFLLDFEYAIKLIGLGILNCHEIWSWCFTKVDLCHMTGAEDRCSKYSLITTANDLLQYKLFGLTAAGIKHDVPRFMPYQYSIQEEQDEEKLDVAPPAEEQYFKWLTEAGGILHDICQIMFY
jgi:hypothetical protein